MTNRIKFVKIYPRYILGVDFLMDTEFSTDLITLVDDEGIEREFEVLDYIENDNGRFYALVPNFDLPEDVGSDSESTYFIFQIVEENGEEQLAEVEDDNLLDELAEIFESRFNQFPEEE